MSGEVVQAHTETVHAVQPDSWYRWRDRSVTYQLEWVLCGKPSCTALHGPYWYAYWQAPAGSNEPWKRSRKRKLYIGRILRSLTAAEIAQKEGLGTARSRSTDEDDTLGTTVDDEPAIAAAVPVVPKERPPRDGVPKARSSAVPKKRRGGDRRGRDRAAPKKRRRRR